MKSKLSLPILILLLMLTFSSFVYSDVDDFNFYKVFDNHGSIVLIIDSESADIIYGNKAATKFYGYEKEILQSMKITDINILSAKETEKEMEDAVSKEKNCFIFKHRLSSGDIRTVEVYSYPYESQSRSKTFLVSIINDISEKETFEKEKEAITTRFIVILSGTVMILIMMSMSLWNSSKILRLKNLEVSNSNELFKTFIDAKNSLIFLKDENLKHVFVNKETEKFFQKEANEIIGRDDFELPKSETAIAARELDLEVLEKGTNVVGEIRHEDKIYQVIKFPVKLISGGIGVGAYVSDISEDYNNRIKLEETNILLKENKESLRLILDSTAEAIYGVDMDDNCTFCNASFLKLLGYRHENEVLGKKMHGLIHCKKQDGSNFPLEECKLFTALKKGEGVHVEDEVLWRADGTSFPVSYYSYPQIRDGEVIGAVVTFTDITERIEAKEELINTNKELEEINKQLQEKQYSLEEQNAYIEELNSQLEDENIRYLQQREILQALVDSLGAGAVMTDLDGKILFINEAWKELFNYLDFKEENYLKDSFYINNDASFGTEIFFRNTVAGIENKDELFNHLISLTKDTSKKYSIDVEQKQPIRRFLNLYSNPCISETGNIFGRVFVVRDISHQKEIDKMKTELISTVSHELRTPMSSILGFSELLLTRELDGDRKKEYVEIINSEAQRLTDLVSNFLDIQKIENGIKEYDMQVCDMKQIVIEAIKLFDKFGGKHKFVFEYIEENKYNVVCDKSKILQVLSNLISNSIKYSPGGSDIKIFLTKNNECVTVTIADLGLGIPEESKDKIFDKFYRVNNDDRRKIGGTGLGLAISKEIIVLHGGNIEFESTLGQGSTFYFNLPLAKQQSH
ncbi:MAG: PAS domain S-box protein [Firmicutes bacterium]|nr:PAS domain S-box protein [Bacillota bacterium]